MPDEMDPAETPDVVVEEMVVTAPPPAPEPEPTAPVSEMELAYDLGRAEAFEKECRAYMAELKDEIGGLRASLAATQGEQEAQEEVLEEVVEEVMPEDHSPTPKQCKWWEKIMGGH